MLVITLTRKEHGTFVDVVTIGESMVVLAPERPGPLDAIDLFRKDLAGAESNVAIGLARLDHQVAWIGRLGAGSLGRYVYKTLRGEGVDVSAVAFDAQHRTGVYFKEFVAGQTSVYYYRADSAASHLQPEEIDLTPFGARYLFITGITPALSLSARQAIWKAIEQAHELQMTVVLDPNLRLKLWAAPEAREVLDAMAGQAEIVLPGLAEAQLLTERTAPEEIAEYYLKGRTELVVVKLGPDGAYYRTHSREGFVAGFTVQAVDEIGAGDAFDAGLLSGLLDGLDLPSAVKRGNALGAMVVMGIGDYTLLPDRCELERFLAGKRETGR